MKVSLDYYCYTTLRDNDINYTKKSSNMWTADFYMYIFLWNEFVCMSK